MTWRNERPHPGPWRWADESLVDGDGDRILECTNDAEEVYANSPADAGLIADAPAMRDLLRELEWTYGPRGESYYSVCPKCGTNAPHDKTGHREPKHETTCRLGALLDKHGRG